MMKQLLVALLVFFSIPAFANNADSGFYAGVGLGEANVDDAEEYAIDDDSDVAFRVYGGFEFNKWLAFEIGYMDFGSYHGSAPSIEGPIEARVALDSWTASFRPQVMIGSDWFVQAQLGYHFWDADARLSGGSISAEFSEDGEDPFYGIGFGRNFGTDWRLSAEWTRFESDDADIDFLNLALNYRFGR